MKDRVKDIQHNYGSPKLDLHMLPKKFAYT